MNPWTRIFASTMVAGIGLHGSVSASQAVEPVTVNPLQAVDFDFENKRAVSYFSRVENTCEVVVSMAEALEWTDGRRLMTSRFEAPIADGGTGRVQVAPGKALEFTCLEGAQRMKILWLDQLASSATGK